MPVIPLHLLSAGEHARVVDIDGDQSLITRLHEMGLREQTEVTMIQSGRPCIIAIGNHRLSFRGEEAAVILVETIS